jgi:uncharacterized membrane protein YeaQ/YmgE (transglycosylase-associated protein family)
MIDAVHQALSGFVLKFLGAVPSRNGGRPDDPRERLPMSIIAWILLGLVAGFIASKVVNGTGEGLFLDMALGVVGAFVGGAAFHLIGHAGVTGFNLWSLFVSVMGSILVLIAYHAVRGRRARA